MVAQISYIKFNAIMLPHFLCPQISVSIDSQKYFESESRNMVFHLLFFQFPCHLKQWLLVPASLYSRIFQTKGKKKKKTVSFSLGPLLDLSLLIKWPIHSMIKKILKQKIKKPQMQTLYRKTLKSLAKRSTSKDAIR